MLQLIQGIAILHQNQIFHRDLKPLNILVLADHDYNTAEDSAPRVCLADFGLAVNGSDKAKLYHKCGSPGYMDPEFLNKSIPYSEKSDIFSMGCIFFNLATGKQIFRGATAK